MAAVDVMGVDYSVWKGGAGGTPTPSAATTTTSTTAIHPALPAVLSKWNDSDASDFLGNQGYLLWDAVEYNTSGGGEGGTTDTTEGPVQVFQDETFIFVLGGLFTVCYLLAGLTCCRCYWLHLRKRLEGDGVIFEEDGGATASKAEEGKVEPPDGGQQQEGKEEEEKEEEGERKNHANEEEQSVVETNEFLEARCC